MVLIGAGGWGQTVAHAARHSPLLDLAGVCDLAPASAADLAARLACRVYADPADVFADAAVEAVLIVTPNVTHGDLLLGAAQAGKHAYVEKPLAATIAEARAALAAFRAGGRVLAVGHNDRLHPAVERMKALITEGVIGRPILAEANFSHSRGLRLRPDEWRWYRDRCRSGPLVQMGIHHVDTLQDLLGPVRRVASFFNRLATPAEVEDVTATVLEFESGVLAYLGAAWSVEPAAYLLTVYGTEGRLHLDSPSRLLRYRKDSDVPETVAVGPRDSVLAELEAFARAVRGLGPPAASGEDGLRALAVVIAAIQSADASRAVSLNEVLEPSASAR